jgi:hypothetical protein
MSVSLAIIVAEDVQINIIIRAQIVQKAVIYGKLQIRAQYAIISVPLETIHFQRTLVFQETQANITPHQRAEFAIFVIVTVNFV